MDFRWHYDSPLGGITLRSDGYALTGLCFDGQQYSGDTSGPGPDVRQLRVFDETCRWLDLYFQGKDPGFTPVLRLHGTPFRMAVWEILRKIPYGRTMTYGEIATSLAVRQGRRTMSAQAVGGAVGHNPISLIIPCHRVIGAGGVLTGYAAGLDRKARLLQIEGVL